MTNPDYTHVTLVVDRSGSMDSVRAEAENGINALLAEQFGLDGKFTATLVDFDTEVRTVNRLADEAFEYRLVPRGMTALLDAVGQEIHRTGTDLAAMPEDERPGKVLFVVVTDGDENSSEEFTLDTVRSLIAKQRDQYAWAFQFLGASDAAWQGAALGMNTTAYAPTGAGTSRVYGAASQAMSAYRAAPAAAPFEMPEDLT